MIGRMYGSCNGKGIEFYQKQDCWSADVPFDFHGEYVVSIIAVDRAGNHSYLSTILFEVREGGILISIVGLDYKAILQPEFVVSLEEVEYETTVCTG